MRTLSLPRRSALTLAGGGLLAGLSPLPALAQAEDWAALGADVKVAEPKRIDIDRLLLSTEANVPRGFRAG